MTREVQHELIYFTTEQAEALRREIAEWDIFPGIIIWTDDEDVIHVGSDGWTEVTHITPDGETTTDDFSRAAR